MKVVCVVDSITDFNNKVLTIKSHFGDDIVFIVKAALMPIFTTYGFQASAIYDKNLSKIIHITLLRCNKDDTVVYFTSLKINNLLLSDFINKIGNREKIVNFVPKYNSFEKICLKVYNLYTKTIFKSEDCLASPKLQFLPQPYIENLLTSHFANRMFEMPSNLVVSHETDDAEINKTAKIKTKFGKSELISIIVALIISLSLLLTVAFAKMNYIITVIFVLLYVLDFLIYIILKCKFYFDSRFLK